MRLRVLDLDGSVTAQPALRGRLRHGQADILDLRAEGPSLRLWAGRRARRRLSRRLAGWEGPDGPAVTLLGSGDYHHLAALLMAPVAEPFTVVHFDNHPDWVRLPPAWHCGSAVNRILDLPQVRRVVTLGPCADDLHLPELKGGNLAALAAGRLEIHPWRRPPTRLWRRLASGPGRRGEAGGWPLGGQLEWDNLADQDWGAFVDRLIARLPTDAVWITVDKDVLRPTDAATNWEAGQMPLDCLVRAIGALRQRRRVIGADICGEWSEPAFASPIKRVASWLDRPASPPPGIAALERNGATNLALLAALGVSLGVPGDAADRERAA